MNESMLISRKARKSANSPERQIYEAQKAFRMARLNVNERLFMQRRVVICIELSNRQTVN